MILQKLEVFNVRNLLHVSILPSPRINLIYGKNGSGKSSLLEAIYILGRAKSFRSSSIRPVIKSSNDNLVVSAKAQQQNGEVHQLGVKLDVKNITIRINQENCKRRSDLAYALPLQIIHPKSYKLLDAGPQLRREFIDWGVFNLQDEFLHVWRKYKKALAQRNQLLKKKFTRQLHGWDRELVQHGLIVADFRRQYITLLQPLFVDIAREFMDFNKLKIQFVPGWDRKKDFSLALQDDIDKDLRFGITHSGPHRGDFLVSMDNKQVKDFVSRGQLKLLVLALQLAQVKLLYQKCSKIGCILIDDVTSELDCSNRAKLLHFLSDLQAQVFLTATELNEFGDLSQLCEYHVFHVEHGNIKPV
jgi:DNA replication and repair protein RecF